MRVVVYTRQGCPLCDKGIDLARKQFGSDSVVLVDIDLDLALLERYTDRVPVIETLDGQIVDEGIVTSAALAAFKT